MRAFRVYGQTMEDKTIAHISGTGCISVQKPPLTTFCQPPLRYLDNGLLSILAQLSIPAIYLKGFVTDSVQLMSCLKDWSI